MGKLKVNVWKFFGITGVELFGVKMMLVRKCIIQMTIILNVFAAVHD